MIKETRKYFCDACGAEITGYSCRREVIELDEDGYAHSVGYDFCESCTHSFNAWKDRRRRKRTNNYITRLTNDILKGGKKK